jgi:TonB family protein
MNASPSRRPLRALSGVVALFCAATAYAQEPLTKARALYDAAAYEEALTLLDAVELPEAQQYRALCLLALGRAKDATGAVERLISTSPTFELSSEDVPPRFVALFSDARKRLLPGIARKAFNDAREEFRSGEREEALRKFDLVLTLASSAGFKDAPEAEDLRTLASGFIELARATAPARPEPKASEAPQVAEAPAASASPETPLDVVQPVAVRQLIPPVPSGVNGLGSPTASVRVLIGADGKVLSASMQQSSHPLYDRLVLQAARDWLYRPATLNGRPVPSEKIVTIHLR